MSGKSGETVTSGLLSVLEFRQPERIFRNRSIYQAGTDECCKWNRDRGTR